MENYDLTAIKYAKESGTRARNSKLSLCRNPYNQRVGNIGKQLKAAWHNAWRKQDKLVS